MTRLMHRLGLVFCLVATTLLLAACGSKILNRAPVEDRQTSRPVSPEPVVVAPGVASTIKMPQGFENAGKPGYYTVKPGDTLLRIALEHGQTTKDIARWSQVDNPNRIDIGQVLRVAPPTENGVVVKPVTKPAVAVMPNSSASSAAPATAPVASASSATAPVSTQSAPEADINWLWPANGSVLAGFDEVKNKGLDIGGKVGEPVLASADGRVVYVGAGLRGYGNLIILKHNNVFLTAYAHNQTLLVKEDQSVLRGQKIAEMGNSDTDTVKLHFEVRRQGKPVDPLKYLPAR